MSVEPASGHVTVHVTGGVQTPGVYQLQPGARVYDAIRAAGGFVTGADDQSLNLASFVSDGEQVFVPTRTYAQAPSFHPQLQAAQTRPSSSVTQSTPRQSSAPAAGVAPSAQQVPTYSAGSPYDSSSGASPGAGSNGTTRWPPASSDYSSQPGNASATSPSASSTRSQARTSSATRSERTSASASAAVRFPININSASKQELEALPYIGPVKAGRIIEYRIRHGPFQRMEDIMKVKGIGQKTLGRMAPYITL